MGEMVMSLGYVYLTDGRMQPLLAWRESEVEEYVTFACESGLYRRFDVFTFDFDTFSHGASYEYYRFDREQESWNKTTDIRKVVYLG
jgi:hypothetical protein